MYGNSGFNGFVDCYKILIKTQNTQLHVSSALISKLIHLFIHSTHIKWAPTMFQNLCKFLGIERWIKRHSSQELTIWWRESKYKGNYNAVQRELWCEIQGQYERLRQAASWILGFQGRLHRRGDFHTGCWKMNRNWQVLGISDRKLKERHGRRWVTQGFTEAWDAIEVEVSFQVMCWGRKKYWGWDRERKQHKFHFGHAEFNAPAECSRGWVGLELKSKAAEYRFKNIRLKLENKKKEPAELMQGVYADWDKDKPRMTRMNKTNYRKGQHVRGMWRNRDREDWETVLDPHKEVVFQKSSAGSIDWCKDAK